MKARFSVPVLCLLLLLGSVVPAAPGAAAPAEGTFRICATLANAVGWPVAGMEVRALPADTTNQGDLREHAKEDDQNALRAVTDALGRFWLDLDDAQYVLLFRDLLGAASPARGGATYTSEPYFVKPGRSQVVAGACFGVEGIRIAGNGQITVDSPGQGFLEVSVADGARKDAPGLDHADVAFTPAFDARDLDPTSRPLPFHYSFHAHTEPDGVARLACPAFGETPGAGTVLVSKYAFVDASRVVECVEGKLRALDVTLWRRPVTLVVNVSEELDPTRTRGEPDAGTPVPGADVGLAASPASLQPVALLCGDAPSSPFVAVDDASPYVCGGKADSAGLVQLRLPWADESYAVRASSEGYLPAEETVSLAQRDTESHVHVQHQPGADVPYAVDAHAAEPARRVDLTLVRPRLELAGAVQDIVREPVAGAQVRFAGDVDDVADETDASGAFRLTLATGHYNLTISKAGYNDRHCLVKVGIDAEGAAAVTWTDNGTDCWKLVTQGKSVVSGFARDGLTSKPIPGLRLCGVTDCSVEATTLADGFFALELDPDQAYAIQGKAGESWRLSFPRAGTAPSALNGNVSAGTITFDRAPRTLNVAARSATEALPNSEYTILRDGATVKGWTRITAANGIATESLPWTRHASLPQFDVGDYVVKTRRHLASPHMQEASSSGPLPHDGTATITVTMTEEGSLSTAVTAKDPHTLAPLGGLVLSATIGGGLACGPTCSGSELVLYDDPSHTYQVCAEKTGYVKTCASNVKAGQPVSLDLPRAPVVLTVKVLDAHTDLPVQGVTVSVAAADGSGFRCKATGASPEACDGAGATGADGKRGFSLPWAEAGKLCVAVAKGQGTLPAPASAENAVPFQTGGTCPVLPPGVSWELPLKLLRQPGADILVKVAGPSGEAVPDAGVLPTPAAHGDAPRAAFACDPKEHNSSAAGAFPHCDKVSVGAAAVALRLPAGGHGHLWNLTASAPGRYWENKSFVRQDGATHALVLWPSAFEATVKVWDADALGSPIRCGDDPDVSVEVILTWLDREDTPSERLPTAPKADGSCEARLSVEAWRRAEPADLDGLLVWPKESELVLLEARASGHVGANLTSLGPLARTANLTMRALRTQETLPAAIAGRVDDLDSALLTGAPGLRVDATRQGGPCPGAGGSFSAFTDHEGRYTLRVPCPGTYDVAISPTSPLYQAPAPATVVVTSDLNRILDGRGLPTHRQDFSVLRTRGDLVVTAIDADVSRRPLADVVVDPAGVGVTANPAARATGANGQARFDDLPWGAYAIDVAGAPGHVVLTPKLATFVTPGGSPREVTALVRSDSAEGMPVLLQGRLADADSSRGAGVAGAQVSATRLAGPCPGGEAQFKTVSAATGDYALAVPCAGTYRVQVAPVGGHHQVPAWVDVALAASGPGVGLARQDFSLARTRGTLVVSAADLTPLPRAAAGVSVDAAGVDVAADPAKLVTGADGTATLADLPWGTYAIEVGAPEGHVVVTRSVAAVVAPGRTGAVSVYVHSGRLDTAPALVTGRVADADARDGRGVAAATVTLTLLDGPCAGQFSRLSAPTDPDGGYRVPAPCAGAYRLEVARDDLYAPAAPFTLAVAGGSAVQQDASLARLRGSLTLLVTEVDTPSSRPGSNVGVDPKGMDVTADPAAAVTGADGRVTFPGLPWGVYGVAVVAPAGYLTLTPLVAALVTPGETREAQAFIYDN